MWSRSTRSQTFAGLSETQHKQSIEARTADGQTLRLSRLSDRQKKHIIDTSIAARSALRLSRLSGGQYKQSIDTSCRGAERLQTLWTGMTEVGAVGRQWGGSGMHFLDAFSQAPAAPRWMHFLRHSQHCFGFSDPLSPAHGLRSGFILQHCIGFSESLSPAHGSHSGFI